MCGQAHPVGERPAVGPVVVGLDDLVDGADDNPGSHALHLLPFTNTG
jgi:hypothetical protein